MISLVTIMRAQRYYRYIDFEVMDFVNHSILLVNAARPSFFEGKMLQVLHLPSAGSGVLLKFKEHIGNFLDSSLVTAFLDSSKFHLRLLRKKNNVCHSLKCVDHRHDVLLALQTRKLCLRAVRLADVILYGLHVAAVSKEGVARRANLVGVSIVSWLQQLASQPIAVAPLKRQTLYVSPKFVCCNSCHNFKYLVSRCKNKDKN